VRREFVVSAAPLPGAGKLPPLSPLSPTDFRANFPFSGLALRDVTPPPATLLAFNGDPPTFLSCFAAGEAGDGS
jgi:hypothetical protein